MKHNVELSPQNASEKHSSLVAVVVPVYNVAKYLGECLDSVLSQTYKNITIYAVNDGSTDKSGDIIDEYANKYSNIVAVHKKNGGLSSARNAGLEEIERSSTEPDFIYFLDSDDKIASDFVSLLIEASIQNNADLAISRVVEFDNKTEKQKKNTIPQQTLSRSEFAELYFELDANKGTNISYRFLGNKLFRYSLVKDTRFDETFKMAEDQEWIVSHIMPNIGTTIINANAAFFYRLRKSSLSHSRKNLQSIRTFERAVSNIHLYPSAKVQKGIGIRYCRSAYNQLLYSFFTDDKNMQEETIKAIGRFRRLPVFKLLTIPYKIRTMVTVFPKFLLRIYAKHRINNVKKVRNLDYFD